MDQMKTITVTEMPKSPATGVPLYRVGSAIADVFMACVKPNGATVSEIKRMLNSDVADHCITKHVRPAGKRSLAWTLNVNGKRIAGGVKLDSLAASDRVAIVNVHAIGEHVDTKHHASKPGNTATILASRGTVPETKTESPKPAESTGNRKTRRAAKQQAPTVSLDAPSADDIAAHYGTESE
jgi:hypothetical protein